MCITVCILGSPTSEAEKMEKVKQKRLSPTHIPYPLTGTASLEAIVLE